MLFISDIHFPMQDEAILGRLEAIAATDHGERVAVLPGDLTMTGAESEYLAARDFLRRLRDDLGYTLCVTPGNHDFGRWPAESAPVPFRTYRARYEQYVLAEITGGVVACREYDLIVRSGHHLFVALRSTHRLRAFGLPGRIDKEQVDWACGELSRIDTTNLVLHLVTHRSLWRTDRAAGAECPRDHRPISGKRRLWQRLLAPFRFATVIHGHNHHTALAVEQSSPHADHRLRQIGVPTASTRIRGESGGFLSWDGNLDTCHVHRHSLES